MREKRLFWWILALGVIGFLLLAGKNPFSAGSIIANLQPFPDTLYYATPAWNFVHGAGYSMRFAGYEVPIITPPLYSIYLMPFFALFGDVRVFYFANLLLMGGSIVLFFLICQKIFGKDVFGQLLSGLLTFLLVINFYVYTLPTLLIAENITFFLTTYGLYLLLSKINKRTSIILGLVGILLLLVKFSNFPFTATLFLLYALKSWNKKRELASFAVYAVIFIALFSFYYFFIQQREGSATGPLSLFTFDSLLNNLAFYAKAAFGGENVFLWFRERLISPLLGLLAIAGIVWGFSIKKRRALTFQLTFLILTTVLFMSFFYATDTRYILAILPMVIIFAGFPMDALKNRTSKRIAYSAMAVLSVLILFLPPLNQRSGEMTAISLGKRLVGNVRGNETPWFYLSVNEFNRFFGQKEYKSAYLGTFLPPFYVDFYANGTYRYLPISKDQDFFSVKGGLAEKMKIKNIETYYAALLKKGERVYVSNAFVTNLASWVNEFEDLKRTFKLTRVHEGCLNSCDIFRVELK